VVTAAVLNCHTMKIYGKVET